MSKRKHPQVGSLFEDWLKEEGIHEDVTNASIKRVLAWQVEKAMKEQKISKSAALGSIVLERIFDGLVISLTPFLLLTVIDLPPWLRRINFALLALYIIGLAGLVVVMQRGWTETWIKKATALLPMRFAYRAGVSTTEFLHGMKGITRSGALLPVSLLSLICWVVHGMYFFLMFRALDLNVSFGASLILQMIIGLGVVLPAAPGYVGNFEYFAVLGLGLFGIVQEVALAYALLAHLFQFIPLTAVGLFFTLRSGFQWFGSRNSRRDERFEVLDPKFAVETSTRELALNVERKLPRTSTLT